MPVILASKSKRKSARKSEDEQLIATSLKRFKITAEAESEARRKGLEDLEFSIGTGQWDAAVKANRELEGKPCLTINRAPSFIRQYTGEERQHRPSMIVSPVGQGASQEKAKIHQGVLRHIEVASIADQVYDDSYDMMMRIGWCPWRIDAEYTHERSFDQEPRIRSIDNPFNVYLSPFRRPNGTDPLWGHVIRDYAKDEYESEFGRKTDMAKLNFPTQQGAAEPDWVTKDGCRVAEYWWIELIDSHLWQLDDGSVLITEELKKGDRARVVADRDTVIRKVNCIKHDAMQVLERYEWLGKYLPFPEVNGVRLNVNGKIYKAGMVRDYRDAQRIYDFMVTRSVEQVDQVSKDPLWVPVENAEFEDQYKNLNRKNYSHVYFKAYDANGRQLPTPQRAGREAPIEAMQKLVQQADYDMKAVIGIYGPSLGEEAGSAQESGFAILTRQQQSDQGMVTWHDNLNRAIHWQGVILEDLWPHYINSARAQRIVDPDDSIRHVVLYNGNYGDEHQFAAHAMLNPQQGLTKAYDVSEGMYDLTLNTGPMYRTAREEAFRALTVVITKNPELFPILGDIWAKNADFPDNDVIEQRLKKMLPPQLQEAPGEDPAAQVQALQGQLAALTGTYNQVLAELNRAADTIRTKKLENDSRERIALSNNQTQLTLQMMKDLGAGASAHLQAQIEAIQQRLMLIGQQMTPEQEAGQAPNSPELPNSVEPKVQPITPAAPAIRPQPM